MRTIVDPRLSLVFVHWGIPHPPAIYNAAQDDFSYSPENSYVDNLKLVDRTIRDIRLTLERAGMWDTSTILITSDHSFRVDTWDRILARDSRTEGTQSSEVPFLLKMKGQQNGLEYAPVLQTVITKDLVMNILKGEISQPEQVMAWLNRNPTRQ
jgi:phosphoglycerol transferase MdoB-like AlkP superfamily enzyme